MSVRVRFAPSPTGFLHVGGARTALYNWLLARREKGAFLLRIEDTDRDRSSLEMVQAILDGLSWLGIDWDEEPVLQSAGIERHRADAVQLLERGFAYRDFTDPEELRRLREEDPARALVYPRSQADSLPIGEAEERARADVPHAVRFRVPPGETVWEDSVHGVTRFRNEDIEDLVLLRSDGTPTYNLAVASDDADMGITHVIRGDDHVSNTPKQILIHRMLGRALPVFAHVPMILGPDGKRLSKRHGATAISEYREQGILPDAMVNFLALLGWSPGTDEEILSRAELVSRFSLERVLKKGSIFDTTKLEWLNRQHLARLPMESLADMVLGELGEHRPRAEAWQAEDSARFHAAIELQRPRSASVRDLARQLSVYLAEGVTFDPAAVAKYWEKSPGVVVGQLQAVREALEGIPWNAASIEEALRGLAETQGVAAGAIIHPLRVALTGQGVSPGIFEVLFVLGRERAFSRIEAALQALRSRAG
ncbi:MAG: glutamate--tRNA ligase [Gemmatimonadetes bacterium]|nr:glutamate--tRNA ligase [Gemmatimonadota bacterium]